MLSHLEGAKVCVTGGTGFLGRHLLPELIKAGAHVSCLVRSSKKAEKLPAGVKIWKGDLASGEGLAEAFYDQDILIHLAGCLFAFRFRDYLDANVRACEHIVHNLPAERANRPRVVFVSSLAAVGPCSRAPGLSEKAIPAPVSAYGWSKLLSENILARHFGDRLVILRPPIIYGSGDAGLLPLFKSVAKGIAVSPGAFRKFPVSAIHASDAAKAVLLASSPRASGVYHLNDGHVHDMDIFCAAMGKALGREKIYVAHAPLSLMALTSALSSAWGIGWNGACELLGLKSSPPRWNIDKYREAREDGWLADASRIQAELGFRAEVDLASGMAEAVAGYRAEGLL